MAARTTRNKIRLQAQNALNNLTKAQSHMVQLAALADDRSDLISVNLPPIIAANDMVIKSFEKFAQGL